MGSWARRAIIVAFVGAPACTLLTPLDDFSGGDDGQPDGSSIDAPLEAAKDGAAPKSDAGDAAMEADANPSRSAAYAAAVVADKPIPYWRFEETTGTVAKDEMGAHDGAYVLGPTLGMPGIIPGTHAVKFPTDKNARITVSGDVFRFAGNAVYTMELWALPKVFDDYQWIGGTENPTLPRSGWAIAVEGTGMISNEVWAPGADAAVNQQVRALFLGTKLLDLDRYQHIVFTFDGTTTRGYIDGVLIRTLATPKTAPDTGQLLWGCRLSNNNPAECLDGWSLDEIAVYDHVLDDAHVKAHYDLGKP